MHKILLEETSRSTVEHQRRLNPVMKEVVKKESASAKMQGKDGRATAG